MEFKVCNMYETHCNSSQIDYSLVGVLVVVKNCLCKLRYVMSRIALSSYEKISSFVVGESLQPINKKCIGIPCGSYITIYFVI